jgi:hypothetical protein
MRIDWTVVMLLAYMAGSLCFLVGSAIALWRHLGA